jgi:hypothetical protein
LNPTDKVILCGHSLGAGYAIISAAHLIANGVAISAVRSLGGPQVVVAGQAAHPVWKKLDEVTTR